MRRWNGAGGAIFGLLIMALIVGHAVPLTAAPSPEQLASAKALSAKLKKAGTLFKAKKTKEAADAVREAQASLAELIKSGDPQEALPLAQPLHSQLQKAIELLVLEGESFQPLAALPVIVAKQPDQKPKAAPVAPPTDGPVSFAKHVAPLLVAKCGTCHVGRAKGDFSMATVADLKKGAKESGIVIQPGNSQASRMIELIQSGDMPRGGAKVSAAELAMLSKWIDQGANYDGAEPGTSLAGLAQTSGANLSAITVEQARGNESILFARDIGPVIVRECSNCHSNRNPPSGLSLTTFERLLRGGENGAILSPGDPSDSLIITKLRGKSGARMPFRRLPLDEETIVKFEKWIAEGAKFDGPDMSMPLLEVVQTLFAARATHDELKAERVKRGQHMWKTIIPDSTPIQKEADDFLLIGNVGEEILDDVTKNAETLVPRIRKTLSIPADRPLVKGRMTVFVFDKRYDYSEIGTMVEEREIPSTSRGHWRYTGLDAYIAVLPAKAGEYPIDSLLSQQIAGLYVASLGKVPRWFAEGTGRVVASRIDPKDPRFKQWDSQLTEIVGGGKPDAFLSGGLPGENGDIVSYGFVKVLMANSSKFNQLLDAIRSGTPFDAAFAKSYGGTPVQMASNWTPTKRRGR
jgi:hypothetical protein